MVRTAFNVLYETNIGVFDYIAMTSHFSKERKERHERIVSQLGEHKKFYSFVVDTEHPNGLEVHHVFDNGVIAICNQRTGFLITELIARPGQIRRYWDGLNKAIPIEMLQVIEKAKEYQKNGYNYW